MPDVFSTFFQSFRSAPRLRTIAGWTMLIGAVSVLQACGGGAKPFQPDLFSTTVSPYAHSFNASHEDTCEAARRAMLSQGYTTTSSSGDAVDANKGFQPSADTHVTVSFHVVCAVGESSSSTSVLYVNAVQDNYSLKKSDTSASVGLSILGSVSLPIRSNNDSMVKTASQTIPPGVFYDRFFALVDHYLRTVVRSRPVANDKQISEETLPPIPEPKFPPVVIGNALPAKVSVAPGVRNADVSVEKLAPLPEPLPALPALPALALAPLGKAESSTAAAAVQAASGVMASDKRAAAAVAASSTKEATATTKAVASSTAASAPIAAAPAQAASSTAAASTASTAPTASAASTTSTAPTASAASTTSTAPTASAASTTSAASATLAASAAAGASAASSVHAPAS